MAKTGPPYTPEFRRQMVELVRAGRSPEDLAHEFEPTAQSIRNWVSQAECDVGRRVNGLTTAEREELNQLRRENRQLRLETSVARPTPSEIAAITLSAHGAGNAKCGRGKRANCGTSTSPAKSLCTGSVPAPCKPRCW
jgi:transposase